MKLGMSEILEKTSEINNKEGQIEFLRKNFNQAFGLVLRYAFEEGVVWELPPGAPPYKPCPYPDQEGRLFTEARRLYLFTKGGNDNLKPLKRESMYIQLLESITPADAVMLLRMKDGKLPHPKIPSQLILEAYPGLVQNPRKEFTGEKTVDTKSAKKDVDGAPKKKRGRTKKQANQPTNNAQEEQVTNG
jgi:hypothetical protein